MLQNELYIGNMVQGKKHQRMRSKQRLVDKENWIRVENTHEPIIDHQLWDKVQKLLTKKHKRYWFGNKQTGKEFKAKVDKDGTWL